MYVLVRKTLLLGLFFLFFGLVSGCSTALDPNTDDFAEETTENAIWNRSTLNGYTFSLQEHRGLVYWLPVSSTPPNLPDQNLIVRKVMHISNDEGDSWYVAPKETVEDIEYLFWDSNNHMIAILDKAHEGALLSKDNGYTFETIADCTNGYWARWTYEVFSPDNDRVLLFGLRGALYESTTSSGYAWWNKLQDSPEEIRKVFRTSSGRILAGSGNGSIYIVSFNDFSWDLVKPGTYARPITSFIELPEGRLLASKSLDEDEGDHAIFISDDDGLTWHEPTQGITYHRVSSLHYHDESATVFALALNGIHASSDNGNTWVLHTEQPRLPNGLRLKPWKGAMSNNYLFIASPGPNGVFRALIDDLLASIPPTANMISYIERSH